jgi:Protein of unknown function (DUF2477)
MAWSHAQVKQFRHNYSALLVQAWTQPKFLKLLHSSPVVALEHVGIKVADTATVKIDDHGDASTQNDFNKQVTEWEAGETSGHYKLYLPKAPQIGAGDTVSQDTSYCCCCCPCCTCT